MVQHQLFTMRVFFGWSLLLASSAHAFQSMLESTRCSCGVKLRPSTRLFGSSRRTKVLDMTDTVDGKEYSRESHRLRSTEKKVGSSNNHAGWHPTTTAIAALITISPTNALAAATTTTNNPLELSQGYLDPAQFVPVCAASDSFYRFLQQTTLAVVGRESFVEYGPLIAGGLLRVRLELCVVESFINEAVVPFVRENGLSWVLPLHETVETFLAGVVFALATTFILIGSTKILTVIVTYTDFVIGLPCRLFGGFSYDRAMGKPVTLDIGLGPFKTRIVGPPAKEDGTDESKSWGDLGPVELLTALVSGTVKIGGESVGVSRYR
jgi:hypothetical protein